MRARATFRKRTPRAVAYATFALVAFASLAALTSCKARESDMAAWETEDEGPQNLVRVVTTESEPLSTRTKAALVLARLTRNGRHVGVDLLLDALAGLPAPGRAALLADLTPALVAELGGARQDNGDDATVGAKDVACGLDLRGLATDSAQTTLEAALAKWLAAAPVRLADTRGRYGAWTLLATLGAHLRDLLPRLLADDVARSRVVTYVRETKDAALLGVAARSLTELANAQRAKHDISAFGVLVGAMRELPSATSFLIELGADPSVDSRVRQLALADADRTALSGVDIDRLFAIVTDERTPDDVIDAAAEVLESIPIPNARLDALIATGGWRARYAALTLELAHAKPSDLDAFMKKLPSSPKTPIGSIEVRDVAVRLVDLAGRDALRPYLTSRAIGPKLVAIAAFENDDATLRPFLTDPTPLPDCPTCGWDCNPLAFSPLNLAANAPATPAIANVGQWVSRCELPGQK